MKRTLLLLCAVILFSGVYAQKVKLSLNLKKGETYQQVSSSQLGIDQTISGQKIHIQMVVDGTTSYTVTAKENGNYVLDAEFKKLSFSMQTPQGMLDFSSEKENSDNPISELLSSIKGKVFSLTITSTGKVLKVSKLNELWNDVIDQNKKLPEAQKEQIKTQLIQSYGDKAVKGNFESSMAVYPDDKVAKGSKWTINTSLQNTTALNVATTYQLADLTSDYAFVKGDATLKTPDTAGYSKVGGMNMKYELGGTITSEIKLDRKTGWVIEAHLHQKVDGKTSIQAGGNMPDGMSIPMTMTNETVITD